jgi:hypothetical protein
MFILLLKYPSRCLCLLRSHTTLNVHFNVHFAGWGQLTDNNTPPVIYLDRNWVIQNTDPVGEVIARVKAEDPEKDHLEYGLEAKGYNGAGSPQRPLPFAINSTTGVVKINESLINRVSYHDNQLICRCRKQL